MATTVAIKIMNKRLIINHQEEEDDDEREL